MHAPALGNLHICKCEYRYYIYIYLQTHINIYNYFQTNIYTYIIIYTNNFIYKCIEMLWSKTIVQQQKLVTLRLTGKPSFYIKHDCCSMMDSKLMYYHYFYSPFINTMSTVLHLKEGRLNPQQQKTDPNITGIQKFAERRSVTCFFHIFVKLLQAGPRQGGDSSNIPKIFFGVSGDACYVICVFLEDLGPKTKRKKGNNLRICKFWMASASSWVTRLSLQNYIYYWDPKYTTSQFCS